MRLEISYRGKKRKKHKHMVAKQYVTEHPKDHWRNPRGNKKIPRDKLQQKHNYPKPVGCSKSSSKREVYSDKGIPQETKKTQINNLTYHLTKLEKEEQTKSKVSRRKETMKIRWEIK